MEIKGVTMHKNFPWNIPKFMFFVPCYFPFPNIGSVSHYSSGSSDRVRGTEKHEIYVAAFGSHFLWLIFTGSGGGCIGPIDPLDPLLNYHFLHKLNPFKRLKNLNVAGKNGVFSNYTQKENTVKEKTTRAFFTSDHTVQIWRIGGLGGNVV